MTDRKDAAKDGKTGETRDEKRGKKAAAKKLEKKSGKRPGSQGQEKSLDRAPKWQPVYPGSGRLAGMTALITGEDNGIGRAVCALFAREGANIALVYHCDDQDAQDTHTLVKEEGGNAILLRGDVSGPEFCASAVAATIKKFGRLDVLVNNAGKQQPETDIRNISPAQLDSTFNTNIFSMFYMVQAALPHLKAGAAIINCTSVTMYKGSEALLDYSATKGAITAFTRSLSANLIGKGIRVNAVAPGPIWTPLNPLGGATPEKVRDFGESTPMERPGEPNEVAPAFLFLACADSSYMSGQVLHPNGGIITGS